MKGLTEADRLYVVILAGQIVSFVFFLGGVLCDDRGNLATVATLSLLISWASFVVGPLAFGEWILDGKRSN